MSHLLTPQQYPLGVRASPRLSGGSGRGGRGGLTAASPSPFASIDSLFASPPLRPLHSTSSAASSSHHPAAASQHGGGGGGHGEFAHPAPIGVAQSPLAAPVNTAMGAMGFMKSLNRSNGAPSSSAAQDYSSRSRRDSLAGVPAFDQTESKHIQSTPHLASSTLLLRSTSTSPTISTRSMQGFLEASPFMSAHRRSPRGHSSPSPFQSLGSPSPSLGSSLAHSHSPNISFALPSPSLLHMNTPSLGPSRTGERDLNGGLSMNHNMLLNSSIFQHWEGGAGDSAVRRSPRFTHQMPLSASRRSPSFTMFSPPTHAQSHFAHVQSMHQADLTASASASRSGSTQPQTRHLRDRDSGPHMSPPLNSVPSSPNLSILGKLRSLHNQPGSGDRADPLSRSTSPHMKLEDNAHQATGQQTHHHHQQQPSHQQQHHRSLSGKRGRVEYESASPYPPSPSPSSHHHHHHHADSSSSSSHQFGHHHHATGTSSTKMTPHFSGAGYGQSPAMVGALPPSQHISMADVSPAPDFGRSPAGPAPRTEQPHHHHEHTPKRVTQKPSKLKQESAITPVRHGRLHKHASAEGHLTDDGSQSDAAASSDTPATAVGGSGSSCHQCKSRRLVADLIYCCNSWRKGKDKKIAPTATSSAAHSCRKKYCGACLQKFYNERAPAKRSATNSEFVCPACRGICCCAACRRIKARQLGEIDPAALSPASMLAYSYVYCPEVLLASMGNEEEGAESTSLQADTHVSPPPPPAPMVPPSTAAMSASSAAAAHYYYAAAYAAAQAHQQQQAALMAANANAHANHGGGKGKGKRAPPPDSSSDDDDEE